MNLVGEEENFTQNRGYLSTKQSAPSLLQRSIQFVTPALIIPLESASVETEARAYLQIFI